MTDREHYTPGPAYGAQVNKDGEDKSKWTLILVRQLRHSPEKVWQALTDPAHLREWAPFVTDANLGYGGNGEPHLGSRAHAAGNKSDASRASHAAGVR